MTSTFTGRAAELSILRKLMTTNNAELVAVVGRRRVGKTYLIKHGLGKHFSFYYTGIKNTSTAEQLTAFCLKLSSYDKRSKRQIAANNWIIAFDLLKQLLSKGRTTKKKVIFLDELPWMAGHKSGFLSAFEHFWNDWAVNQNVIVVICGSATSWMNRHIINNKAGLHNRITKYISLKPFDLSETEAYFKAQKINMPRFQIIQIYMALGGIPQYLKEVEKGESAAQTIDKICFSAQALLASEFSNLYRALFDNYEKYEEVVKALSKKKKGLTRKDIIKFTSLTNGGGLSRVLRELEECSFIETYLPYGKRERETLYRLVDEFSIFYLSFMVNHRGSGQHTWMKISQSAQYKAWAGYAFEGICMKHVDKIKAALGISGVYTEHSSYVIKGTESKQGAQIDMLIDRQDNAINLCEMKYYSDEIVLTKAMSEKLRKRRELFREQTKTRKYLFTTLVTTYGLQKNKHSIGVIDQVITLNDLFSL